MNESVLGLLSYLMNFFQKIVDFAENFYNRWLKKEEAAAEEEE